MPYSLDPLQYNCYPDTAVLINRFDIRNEKELEQIEADITKLRINQWAINPLSCSFDFEYYKAIHAYLFGDLYDWAGQIRTVNISKRGTVFCPAEKIETQAELIFARLKRQNYFKGFSKKKFINEFVDFYCVTNNLHPFREGNGRTQRVFLAQLADQAGYELNYSELDVDFLMLATIQASQGVTDLLRQIFMETIRKA